MTTLKKLSQINTKKRVFLLQQGEEFDHKNGNLTIKKGSYT